MAAPITHIVRDYTHGSQGSLLRGGVSLMESKILPSSLSGGPHVCVCVCVCLRATTHVSQCKCW